MECSEQPPKSGATFFRNVDCPYFPCHADVDPMWFNCLFCYCPLYALGSRCGGDFTYTDNGIKDCSHCTRLHEGDAGIHLVKKHFAALADLARLNGPRGSELPE